MPYSKGRKLGSKRPSGFPAMHGQPVAARRPRLRGASGQDYAGHTRSGGQCKLPAIIELPCVVIACLPERRSLLGCTAAEHCPRKHCAQRRATNPATAALRRRLGTSGFDMIWP